MEVAKKITLQGINSVRGGFKNVKERRFIGRILGIAQAVDLKDSAFGSYHSFTGEFRGINEDGEETVAPVCIMPPMAAGPLASALKDGSVKFGFDFFVEPNEKSSVGYEIKCKPLMEVKNSSFLDELVATLPPAPKKLDLLSAPEQDSNKVDQALATPAHAKKAK